MSSDGSIETHRPAEAFPARALPAITYGRERHATWLELFFDLCFVAAVAVLAASLYEERSVLGLVRFLALFVPVWWAWTAYTWYATAFATDDTPFRLGLLTAMLAAVAVAAGLDGSVSGDRASDTFVVGYVALQVVLVALFLRAHRRFPEARPLTLRYLIGDAIGAALWLVSLPFDESVRPWIWAAAMLVLLVTPALAIGAVEHQTFDPAHIPERYGLFTLIVLGESIIFTVDGLAVGADLTELTVAVLGFVLAASIWWVYFGRVRAIPGRERLLAAFVWGYGHLPVFAGIAAAAVGFELAVEAEARNGELQLVERLILGGGIALYLLAIAAIHLVTIGPDRVAAVRLLAAAAIVALVLLGGPLAPLPFVACATGITVGVAAWEAARERTARRRRVHAG